MKTLRRLIAILVIATPLMVLAQGGWPSRPITLVVPYAPGGPTDIVARTIAVSMSKTIGQTVIVENRVGAGGTIGTAQVARAAPDGSTFLIHHMAMATYPALWKKLSFDAIKDFEYVGQVVDVPMTSISYQGTAPAMNALVGGQVDLMCDQTTQTVPHIRAGTVKFFGMTTRNRVKVLPDASTLDELGLKDFDMQVWHGIYAPKRTPRPITDKMSVALRTAMKDPDVVRRMQDLGAEILTDAKMTPEGLESHLKAEIDKWLPAIQDAGITPQ